MFEPKRILVPTDYSEHAAHALKAAIDIAQKYGSKVFLLHILDQEIHDYAIDFGLSAEQVEAQVRVNTEKAEAMMKTMVEEAGGKGLEVEFLVIRGVPYEAILFEEKERQIDLVVMAPHGSHGLAQYLIGSVTDRVIRWGKAQILIVR